MMVTRILEAVGVALLHSAWQSTAIALSTHWLLCTIPLRHTRQRYRVGLAALVAMVALPVASALRPAPVQHLPPVSAVLTTSPPAMPVSDGSFPGAERPEVVTPAATVSTPSAATSFARALTMLVFPLGVLWIVGVSMRLGVLVLAAYRVRRTIARSDMVVDQRTLHALRDACLACGVAPKRVRLRRVDSDSGPAIVGMIRPSILIPEALRTALPDDALRALFIHELAHLKRRDLLVNPLLQLVDAAFFFHPGARRLVAIVESERERCCDDEVVATGVAPDQYVATLLEVASLTPRPARLTMSATSGGELVRRAERLLAPALSASSLWRTVRYRGGSLLASWAALSLVVPVSMGAVRNNGIQPDFANRLRAIADSAGHDRWIAYAIPFTTVPLSDEERPHSGWGKMIEMGAPPNNFRAASIAGERLLIAVHMARRSGNAATRVTAVAFRTAADVAATLPASMTYLGEVTDLESAAAIQALIEEAPASARGDLLAALALHSDPLGMKLLEGAVTRDSDPAVRAEAVGWLRYRRPSESLPLLRRALNDPHPDVWDEAITTLRRMTDPLGRALLQEAARTNASASVRQGAAVALGRSGTH